MNKTFPCKPHIMNHTLKLALLLTIAATLCACDCPFDVHPYDVHVKGSHGINAKNIALIENRFADNDTLRIAFISDSHGWLDDTRDEVAHINNRADIDFVIHCGDLTDTGTTKEYQWARDILDKLNKPYVALIGNHDFLGTGDQTYDYIFGPKDFSFIVGGVKFVCLNTNATEYDYLAAVPNFDFMETETITDTTRFSRTIIVMHASPYSDQFNNNVAKAFRRYLDFFPGLMCCVYGHDHNHKTLDIYNDGLLFYGVDCALHRNYRVFTISHNDYAEETVFY